MVNLTNFLEPIPSTASVHFIKATLSSKEQWPPLTPTNLLLPLLAAYVFFRSVRYLFFTGRKDEYLSTLPVVGLSSGMFKWTKATFWSIFRTDTLVLEGYNKYNKLNRPFVLPSIDRGSMVIIPPRQLRKIYNATNYTIDIHNTGNETIQAYWTIGDPEVYDNDFQMNVIRNQLTRNLDKITPIIATEFESAFKRCWGTGEEWKEIHVWMSCLTLIAGASNAMFIGAPLCQDEQFLADVRDHATCVFAGATLINATPKAFKMVSGTLVNMACRYLLSKVLAKCLPVVKERLEKTAKWKADPSFGFQPPYDCLQWIIDECYLTKDPAQLDPTRVAKRMIMLNDISLHSTAFMAQNLLFDLFCSDPALGYVDVLREEASNAFREAGGQWTRPAVVQLKLIDSAIRESMRMRPFASAALPRTVVHPNGIVLEENGVNIPRGTLLAVPLEAVHYDEALYPEASTFKPFRFADPSMLRGLMATLNPGEKGENCNLFTSGEEKHLDPEAKAKQGVTLDDAFLGFGFGRHACPGRFFAMNEVKIFVAHVLLNYDIEFSAVRPMPVNTIWLKLPVHGGRLRVRKRTASPIQ